MVRGIEKLEWYWRRIEKRGIEFVAAIRSRGWSVVGRSVDFLVAAVARAKVHGTESRLAQRGT